MNSLSGRAIENKLRQTLSSCQKRDNLERAGSQSELDYFKSRSKSIVEDRRKNTSSHKVIDFYNEN